MTQPIEAVVSVNIAYLPGVTEMTDFMRIAECSLLSGISQRFLAGRRCRTVAFPN